MLNKTTAVSSPRRSNSRRRLIIASKRQDVSLSTLTNIKRQRDVFSALWSNTLRFQHVSFIILIVSIVTCILVGYTHILHSRDELYRTTNDKFIKRLHSWDAHLANLTIPHARVLAPASLVDDDTELLTQTDSLVDDDTDLQTMKRTLVIYSYSHAPWRQENLEFFLRHGLVTHTADGGEVDYTFVFNGYESPDYFHSFGIKFTRTFIAKGSSVDELLETEISSNSRRESDETNYPRVHAVFRENSGFDICSSRIVIEYGLAPRSGTYTHVVFMNGSVRGPFLPSYVTSTWIDMFQQFLNNDVRLVGTTINCMSDFYDVDRGFTSLHVQSMVLALDAVGVRSLLPVLQCYKEYTEAINYGEIGMSQSILRAGFGLSALQGSWREVAIFEKDLNSSEVKKRCGAVTKNTGGDPNHPGAYLEGTVHPLEVIFIKTNRKLDPESLRRETETKNSF
jgi:hypothetical protein